jgi:NAD(P)-dependent dehydrogenase (short-subunit alcohol dehydrogenase family)
MQELRDRVAVVTGAASGIGRALCRRFAAEGVRVVLADVERGALEKTAGELAAEGARVLAVPTDVSKAEQVDALAKRALDAFGAVHVVCNNAGVFTAGTTWEQSLGDWQWVLGVNLWGVVHGVRTFVPILLAQGTEAHVVNTASSAGLVSLPGIAPYNVSKHAVVTLSETLHQELRMQDAKIGVSVLCPGPIHTNIADSRRNRPAELAPSARPAPVGAGLRDMLRAGMDPAEVADLVVRAIRDGRFYILTHDNIKTGVERRMRDILEDRVPRTRRGPDWGTR